VPDIYRYKIKIPCISFKCKYCKIGFHGVFSKIKIVKLAAEDAMYSDNLLGFFFVVPARLNIIEFTAFLIQLL